MELYRSILVCITIIVLSSCSSADKAPAKFTIPMSEIGADVQKGKYLQITAPAGWNQFTSDEDITLEVLNISDDQITSGPDFGARIFAWIDNEWVEVKNKMRYQYQSFTLEPTENYDPLKTVAISVYPELPASSATYHIRIFLIGELIENNNASRKVGSYIDLRLSP